VADLLFPALLLAAAAALTYVCCIRPARSVHSCCADPRADEPASLAAEIAELRRDTGTDDTIATVQARNEMSTPDQAGNSSGQ